MKVTLESSTEAEGRGRQRCGMKENLGGDVSKERNEMCHELSVY